MFCQIPFVVSQIDTSGDTKQHGSGVGRTGGRRIDAVPDYERPHGSCVSDSSEFGAAPNPRSWAATTAAVRLGTAIFARMLDT